MRWLAPVLVVSVLAAPAAAHHGWGSYDSRNVMKFQAQIEEVSYANPHVEIVVVHQGQRWTVTLAPVFRMQNRGLPREAIATGTSVTVEGYPSKVNQHELRAERITIGGKTVELR